MGWEKAMTRLATEEFVPEFCEEAGEDKGNTTWSGGWGGIL